MKITVSLSRKIGQPNYGSLGASCGFEFDAPDELNEEALQARMRSAYAECERAIAEQLDPKPEARYDDVVKRAWWSKALRVRSLAEANEFLDAAHCEECQPFYAEMAYALAKHLANKAVITKAESQALMGNVIPF